MADIGKDLTAASSIPLILSVLSRGESYGYAIIREVALLSDGQLQWTDGMLYPVLHKLEERRLIRSDWRVAEETGRRRKYYQITQKGLTQLQQEQAQWRLVSNVLHRLWEPGMG